MSGIQFNWNCSIKSYKNGQYVRAINTLSLFTYLLHHETSFALRRHLYEQASLRPPTSGRGNPRYLEGNKRSRRRWRRYTGAKDILTIEREREREMGRSKDGRKTSHARISTTRKERWNVRRRKEGRLNTQQGRTYKSLNRCFSRIENSRKTRGCSCPCYVSRGKALGRVSVENAWCERKGIRASFFFFFWVSPFLTALTIRVTTRFVAGVSRRF